MSKFIIKKNPNAEDYAEISEAVKSNDNYCPCLTIKNDDTKCMCKEFRDCEDADFCHCGRFYKVPDLDMIALVAEFGNEERATELFDKMVDILKGQDFIVLPVTRNIWNVRHQSDAYLNLCKAYINRADAVIILDNNTPSSWMLELEAWSEALCKRTLHGSELLK